MMRLQERRENDEGWDGRIVRRQTATLEAGKRKDRVRIRIQNVKLEKGKKAMDEATL
jgi:hypothetical protein